MGAKARYRRQMDAAIASLGDQLSKVNPIDEVKLSPNARRKAEEMFGENLSATDKNLLRKADTLSSQVKNDTNYNNAVGAFNDRYAILKEQLQGRSVERFYVTNEPTELIGGGSENYNAKAKYYASESDAMQEASKNADLYRQSQEESSITPNDFIARQLFLATPTTKGGDRAARYSRLQQAHSDLSGISNSIKSTDGYSAVNSYQSIAEKLQGRLKKAADESYKAPNSTGLLSSETLTGNPISEVLR